MESHAFSGLLLEFVVLVLRRDPILERQERPGRNALLASAERLTVYTLSLFIPSDFLLLLSSPNVSKSLTHT